MLVRKQAKNQLMIDEGKDVFLSNIFGALDVESILNCVDMLELIDGLDSRADFRAYGQIDSPKNISGAGICKKKEGILDAFLFYAHSNYRNQRGIKLTLLGRTRQLCD